MLVGIAIILIISAWNTNVTRANFFHNCSKNWPELDIFVPVNLQKSLSPLETRAMADRRSDEFQKIFLRSFLLFWPLRISNTSLRFLVDSEVPHNHSSYKNLASVCSRVESRISGGVQITSIPSSPHVHKGYDRQQLMMFWADNFTNSEYIGFCDSDTLFSTYVDRLDIFSETSKPIIIGLVGPPKNHHNWLDGTMRALKHKELLRCMTYFPVVVKRTHLAHLRAFIQSQHGGRPFDEIFEMEIAQGDNGYSQFGIMCTFLLMFYPQDYHWSLQHTVLSTKDARKASLDETTRAHELKFNESIVTEDMFELKPRIASHARYRYGDVTDIKKYTEMLNLVLQQGVCISPPFPRQEAVCNITKDTYGGGIGKFRDHSNTLRNGFFKEMFVFEGMDYSNPPHNTPEETRVVYVERLKRLENCSHEWDAHEMERIMVRYDQMYE
mmetsp:Transcript_32332/g.46640  ORF Transcript_32332/g.46640 Transcript_32332/m.46640 type:complete len:440 (+) Transcript_32332:53-1372(+)